MYNVAIYVNIYTYIQCIHIYISYILALLCWNLHMAPGISKTRVLYSESQAEATKSLWNSLGSQLRGLPGPSAPKLKPQIVGQIEELRAQRDTFKNTNQKSVKKRTKRKNGTLMAHFLAEANISVSQSAASLCGALSIRPVHIVFVFPHAWIHVTLCHCARILAI